MSEDLPFYDNNDSNKRNYTPESDSGMNSHPTGDDDSSIRSDVFDNNIIATSTPHREVEDIPQPPNILANKEIQHDNNELENNLNSSSDSHKENYPSNMSDDRSANENGSLTEALYREGPGALTEYLLNSNSYRTSNDDDIYNLLQQINHLKSENSKHQKAYKNMLLENTDKAHTICFQETKMRNLEAMTEEQEKLLDEKDAIIAKLRNDCERIPELETQIKNLHSMIEKQNFSFELQKDEFLKLKENNKELSSKVRNQLSEEYSSRIEKIEEEKTGLKRKLAQAEEDVESAKKKMKEVKRELDNLKIDNKHLQERVKSLSKKPSVNDVGSQVFIPEKANVKRERGTVYSENNSVNSSLDMLYDGIKTPVRNVDFSNTIFTTPGIGDQTMLNKISSEAQEMLSASEKLKVVVDFLRQEQTGGISEDVKHKIIEETTMIIDAEFLKLIKKLIQPLQTFETLSKALKEDLMVMGREKDQLLEAIKKSRSNMEIIAKEYDINCYDNEGQLNVTQFWNNLSLYINELRKLTININKIENETKTTLNGFTPLLKSTKHNNTPKEMTTIIGGGKISPIFNNSRDVTSNKAVKENVLKEMFEKYGEAKEELAQCKENYKKVSDEKKELISRLEKKSKEFSAQEEGYKKSIHELKEIVETTHKDYVIAQTKVKRAKKIIQKLGSSYQTHFDLHHQNMKVDSAAYDCFSVLKHASEYMKTK